MGGWVLIADEVAKARKTLLALAQALVNRSIETG